MSVKVLFMQNQNNAIQGYKKEHSLGQFQVCLFRHGT